MSCRISIIIPVWNGGPQLSVCLASIANSRYLPFQCIVVDDGSTDSSIAAASPFNCNVVCTGKRKGPAAVRNLGASIASGDVLLFLDADVGVHPDTIGRVAQRFEEDPDLGTVIGSYDAAPADRGFVSQYRNLLHCYTHQNACEKTCTFWGACGAIRRDLFLQSGGFSASFERPSTEDIELGYRLAGAGTKMALDRNIQVTHLKRWTFPAMVWCDFRYRAIPWTVLILRYRRMPDDLNVRFSQRLSVLAVWMALILTLFSGLRGPSALSLIAAAVCVGFSIWLDRNFYLFLHRQRGAAFAAAAISLYTLFHAYSAAGFACGSVAYLWQTVTADGLADVPEEVPAVRFDRN